MESEPKLLSLCMIVKNEEAHLARCLGSVAGQVDEMVVVDTGSTDRTIEIARQFGARIFQIPWRDDFAAAKNEALARARGEWILLLDADEEFLGAPAEKTSPEFRPFLQTTTADALQLRVRNRMPPGELEQYQEFDLTRLWRNRPDFRYSGAIHEQIRPAIQRAGGMIAQSPFVILHHGYACPTVQGNRQRAERNLRLLQAALEKDPENPYLLYHLGATYKDRGETHRAQTTLAAAFAHDRGKLTPEIRERLMVKLAQVALAGDNISTARQWANRALTQNPGNLVAAYVVAISLVFEQKYGEARRRFAHIRRHPALNPAEFHQIDQIIQFCNQQCNLPVS